MKAFPASPADGVALSPRRCAAILLLILLAVGLVSVLRAASKPFWYDEICTVIVSRQPSMPQVWQALDAAADTNPPFFYFLTQLARRIVPDDHLGYRLPSILGLLGTIAIVYTLLSRRVSRLSALVGAAFLLCTPLAPYAYDARPYSLMICCIAGAILSWQSLDTSRFYAIALAVTLAAAVSLHYYAILVWPAFALAEAVVLLSQRRFRLVAWAAFAAGAAPLLLFGGLLLRLRQYYGQHFWSPARLGLVFYSYPNLFTFGQQWGLMFAVGIGALLFCWVIRKAQPGDRAIPEGVLTLSILCLPFIAVAMAVAGRGGMTYRYMMPAVLGGALALAYVIDRLSGGARLLLLLLLLINYALTEGRALPDTLFGSLLSGRTAAAEQVQLIRQNSGAPELPVVVSSGLQYLPMAYYTPAGSSGSLYAVTDPAAAVQYSGSDSTDLALLVLQRYFPLQVQAYSAFAARHREFLLISNGDSRDWWAARLLHEGHKLVLLPGGGDSHIYKVSLRP